MINPGEVLIRAENVSKKFCRSLKKSLWYGVCDIARALSPFGAGGGPMPEENHALRTDEFWAVHDVSFELRQGECLGLIGRNGAGKTTLLKMLNGIIKPDQGRIEMRGQVGALIALGAGFNPILTGRENIYINGAVLGFPKKTVDQKIDEIIDFAGVRDFIDSPVQTYSSGMQVRLGFAAATALEPDILLLDEVLAVGDAAFQAKCFNRIGEFRRRGTGFILVAHNMHQITRFCDRTMYFSAGQIKFAGDTKTAVELFNDDMMKTQAGISEDPSAAGAMGSGAVTIEDVFFVNHSEERISQIQAGESVVLCVVFTAHRSNIRDPILDITIRDSADLYFQGSNHSFGHDLGQLPPHGTIRIRFSDIRANDQSLQFNVAFWDAEFTELFDWKRNNRLHVKGNPRCTGRMLLECSWELAATRSAQLDLESR